MDNTQKKLSSRLLYLPLDLTEKVLLWLTYKGLKPVSEITVIRRGNVFKLAKRGIRRKSTYDFNSTKTERIKRWINDAGLSFKPESAGNISWHIGKDKEKVKLSAKIIHEYDYDNELRSGLLFGFPENSAKAYAQNRLNKNENHVPMVWTESQDHQQHYLKDKYYSPYVLYNMPISHVETDSQTAKLWANTIRKDVPILAKWFEKKENKRLAQS